MGMRNRSVEPDSRQSMAAFWRPRLAASKVRVAAASSKLTLAPRASTAATVAWMSSLMSTWERVHFPRDSAAQSTWRWAALLLGGMRTSPPWNWFP